MSNFRWTSIALVSLCGVVPAFPGPIFAETQSAQAFVQSIVQHELKADKNDHSKWMYLDAKTEGGKTTVALVVETSHGDLSKTLAIDGHPLTAQQRAADEQKMHRFVTDPSLRQKQKQSQQHDDKQATALTKMLPEAFLWTKEGETGDETTLSFRPNPHFNPPTREARVLSAMKGTMVVNTKDQRIQSLKGSMTQNVTFGWFGILGKLVKGGTFEVERRPIGDGVWAITLTRTHIRGHALLFKTIGADEDEEKSHFQPTPSSITLAEAEKMLNDGEVARQLGISPEKYGSGQ